jgi:tryptophanyl-tRNA synthetase
MTRVLSGIQPTGRKHLGNYIGAIRHYVIDQDANDAFYCIVDLHAITVPYDPAVLHENTLDTAATLLAAGLDPARCALFVQSHLHEHAEATWLLGAVTTVGELNRMTQFKDKGAGRDSVAAALFTYPVLMTADILLYQADRVPVGDDQRQHLELARNVAQRFNSRFGDTLVVPQAAIPRTGGRVMDLQAPTAKMSTTGGTPLGTVLVTDPPEAVERKIRSAVTDSGREVVRGEGKEGIANLIEIMAVATDRTPEQVEEAYAGAGYGQFKGDVADAVVEYLRPLRERYEEIVRDPGQLSATLAAGAEQARAVAAVTLAAMKRAMGFVAG